VCAERLEIDQKRSLSIQSAQRESDPNLGGDFKRFSLIDIPFLLEEIKPISLAAVIRNKRRWMAAAIKGEL
jgi:hypothetical protein